MIINFKTRSGAVNIISVGRELGTVEQLKAVVRDLIGATHGTISFSVFELEVDGVNDERFDDVVETIAAVIRMSA